MKLIKTVVSLGILGAALYFTNPTMVDFGAYYQRKQVSASQSNTKDAPDLIKKIAGALAESGADLVVKLGYSRSNVYLFSVYTLGTNSAPKERYLGFAKVVFIALK